MNILFHQFKKYPLQSIGLTIIFILCISLIARFFWSHKETASENVMVVEIEPVTRGIIQDTIDVLGTIESEHQTYLSAKAKGRIIFHVNPLEVCKKGQHIASIENDNAHQIYDVMMEAKDLAKNQLDRIQSLKKTGASSQKNLEDQKATLLEGQKRLLDAKQALDNFHIYAPFDGKVGMFKVHDGAEVNPNDPIVLFYDPEHLRIVFDLPIKAVKKVTPQTTVLWDKKNYPLNHIQSAIDVDTYMCPAYITIPKGDALIGEIVDLRILLTEKRDCIQIPLNAIFLKNSEPHVYLVKDNKTVLTPVTLGIKDHGKVEILSGLHEKDALIVKGHNRLYPDSLVKIHEAS